MKNITGNQKKIAITYNTSWYVYNFRLNLIKALQEDGAKIVILAPRDEYTEKLIALGCDFRNIYMESKGKNPLNDLRSLFSIYHALKIEKPDVCLQYTIKPNIYGTLAACLLKIPVINNIAGLGSMFESNGFFSKIALFLYKLSQSKATHIFFQNRDDMQLFVDKKIVKHNRYSLIPGSGVDLSRFTPVIKDHDNSKNVFILVARLLKAKGIEEYAMAAKIVIEKYPESVFQVLGFHDPEDTACVNKAQLSDWIKAGYIDYLGKTDDVKSYLNKADCVVLPSFYREGVPRSLLEAAAMGKPIITTDHVGCRETVRVGYNGYLCEIKNPVDLADKIIMFIELSEAEKVKMGENSRKLAEDVYDEKIVLEAYRSKIKSIELKRECMK